MKKIEIVNQFNEIYTVKLKNTSNLPEAENEQEKKFANALDAAIYACQSREDGQLQNLIDQELDKNNNYRNWMSLLPKKTPKALGDYKRKYPYFDEEELSNEIEKFGIYLPKGQKLFHGGFFEIEKFQFTTRPLSTTFCPYVALRNAESKRKIIRKK